MKRLIATINHLANENANGDDFSTILLFLFRRPRDEELSEMADDFLANNTPPNTDPDICTTDAH